MNDFNNNFICSIWLNVYKLVESNKQIVRNLCVYVKHDEIRFKKIHFLVCSGF